METALTRTLHALADPTRRAILHLLQERDLVAGDIAAQFAISAPSVSHHLNVLKQADLVRAERNGQTIVYAINATVMQEFLGEMMNLFNVGQSANGTKSEDDHA